MDDGIKVVMSPVQLAAALSDKSVTEGETLSNRLYGGLGLIMGTLELAGATALCIAPEPTGLTKAACIIVGAHSMDSINTAADQVLSGKNVRSATYRAAAEMAKQFGADNDTAWKVGLTVDVAVPIAFSLGLGAARVASIRVGRIKLIQHESVTGLKPGGHAILKHVGKTQEELAARLKTTENMVRKPNAISSFSNIELAEASVSKALSVNKEWIKVWAASQPRHNLTVTYNTGRVIGYSLFRGSEKLMQATKVKVVLKYEMYNGKPYYILTAFPEV
ncbi:RNase A-like domain-containing protein [Pseudescherichia vulneris]|uniref:RNase A-like domain-containing protein n=1 Tax=Pseudescherichia vulneris TaxID=566 RepID=UPI0028D259B0|nr:RNase A-like domain-containing protein [Pseudescherichia vulneris]